MMAEGLEIVIIDEAAHGKQVPRRNRVAWDAAASATDASPVHNFSIWMNAYKNAQCSHVFISQVSHLCPGVLSRCVQINSGLGNDGIFNRRRHRRGTWLHSYFLF